MVKIWVETEKKALKIIKAEIYRAEKSGQGNVAQKKKRHLLTLQHTMELSKEKRDKKKKKDELDAEI